MKLLGRLNRSTTKKDRAAHSNEGAFARTERKSSKARKEYTTSPPRGNVYHSKSHQNMDNISRSTGLSFSPSRYDDDATVGGGMTVYDWSVADNAPSVGSAGQLFDDMNQPVDRPLTAPKGKGSTRYFPRRKKENRLQEDSSSDEEGSCTSEQHDEPGELSFQYSMLSDSPTKTQGASVISDATPLRKGGRERNEPNRSFEEHHPNCKISTPKKQQGLDQHFQAQKGALDAKYKSKGPIDIDECGSNISLESYEAKPYIYRTPFGGNKPVDVDEYIGMSNSSFKTPLEIKTRYPPPQLKDEVELYMQGGKTNIMTPLSQPLSAELKGRIHATYMNNSHESANNDYILNTTNASASYMADDYSIENLGDPNSSFGIMTKNLKREEGIPEPGTIWLLDGNGGAPGVTSSKGRELEQLPVNNVRQEKGPEINKIKKTSMKKRVKHKFQSLIGSKSQRVAHEDSCIEKCKLKREISMEPLVGGSITPQCQLNTNSKTRKSKLGRDVSMIPIASSSQSPPRVRFGRNTKNKYKHATNDLSMKALSGSNPTHARNNCRSNNQFQSPINTLNNSVQSLNTSAAVVGVQATDTEIRKGAQPHIIEGRNENESRIKIDREKTKPSDANIGFNERDREKNRQILENWVMGKSLLEFDKAPAVVKKTAEHLPSNFRDENDIISRASSERTPHSCITARVDNTKSQQGRFELDANCPDEDSSAQTPDASSPPSLKHNFYCVVCKEKERTHLASPCMHFSYCKHCADILEKNDKRCRVCNAIADSFSKVLY